MAAAKADVWGQEATGGLDGFNHALTEALSPYADEIEWTLDETIKKIQQRISKVSSKFYTDERMHGKATNTQAHGLVEEFVEAVMQSLEALCTGREWFHKVDFTKVLMFATMYTFGKAKCFTRTLAPMIEKYIEEGIFKWQEEERVQRALWEVVDQSGVSDPYKKKLHQHLQKSFDEAYLKSPYGSCAGESAEVSLLMDFVKGWVKDFHARAWNILEQGVGGGSPDEQILFVTVLFQNLVSPDVVCVPFEIHQSLEAMPASPWDFVGTATEEVFLNAPAQKVVTEEPWPKTRKIGAGAMVPGGLGPKLVASGQPWMPGIM